MYLDNLDRIDRQLVELLLRNARMSYSDLGEAVGLSRVAVRARVAALEERGFRSAAIQAVEAAFRRNQELGKV